jgi:geranylgeranyl transferase type-2 subunit beta
MAEFAEMKKTKIDFLLEKHITYIKKISTDTSSFEFIVSQHLRMSGVYWGLCAISLLGVDVHTDMNAADIVTWVMRCQHSNGGFGGNEGHDPHLLYTLSAIQVLALCGRMDALGDTERIAGYVGSLQQPNGSFAGDKWGEIDTRFSYCAFSSLSLIGKLDAEHVDVNKGIEYISACQNFDGGFGVVPGMLL